MLGLIKKLFGAKPVETSAPYKVEAPKVEASKPKAIKKPTVKKTTTRKPRAPKA